MKLTLLQIVQSILSSMGSDEVNSISDTTESLQVADIVRQSYLNMLGKYDMPEHNQLFQLVASGDITKPVLMTLPPGVTKMDWLKYYDTNIADSLQVDQFGAYSEHDTNTDLVANANGWSTTSTTSNTIALGAITFTVSAGLTINTGDSAFAFATSAPANFMVGTVTSYSGTTLVLDITTIGGSGTYASWTINQGGIVGPVYKDVCILPVVDYINYVSQLSPADGNVGSFTFTNNQNDTGLPQDFTFYYRNDGQPRYCCIMSDQSIIFDSFDNTQDSTLQASKTMASGWICPPFTLSDSWVAPFDDHVFPLLVNDAKALAFFELKQLPHSRADRETNQQRTAWQKFKAVTNRPTYFEETPDYGRRWANKYWRAF